MLAWLLLACGSPDIADNADTGVVSEACNGHVELCDRPFDQVTLPGTHNSMSNADDGWVPPNQGHGLTRQLEDGVRALMLDVHDLDGEPYLCHAWCELGSQPLDEGLGEIETFLEGNPREVVAIIFEDHVESQVVVDVMDEVGLADRVLAAPGGGWPTLGEMVDSGERLVVGAESEGPPPDWYHHAWDLFFDTPYSFENAGEFSCELNRGESDNALFLVNHWVSDPLSDVESATEVNTAEVLGARARECAEQWGRPVNFLGVDFYDVGDLFEVVDGLNGVG